MKLHYYPETDSLYIDLSQRISQESVEVAEHIIFDIDASGRITGMDIQHASEIVDLSGVVVCGIPAGTRSEAWSVSAPVSADAMSHGPAR